MMFIGTIILFILVQLLIIFLAIKFFPRRILIKSSIIIIGALVNLSFTPYIVTYAKFHQYRKQSRKLPQDILKLQKNYHHLIDAPNKAISETLEKQKNLYSMTAKNLDYIWDTSYKDRPVFSLDQNVLKKYENSLSNKTIQHQEIIEPYINETKESYQFLIHYFHNKDNYNCFLKALELGYENTRCSVFTYKDFTRHLKLRFYYNVYITKQPQAVADVLEIFLRWFKTIESQAPTLVHKMVRLSISMNILFDGLAIIESSSVNKKIKETIRSYLKQFSIEKTESLSDALDLELLYTIQMITKEIIIPLENGQYGKFSGSGDHDQGLIPILDLVPKPLALMISSTGLIFYLFNLEETAQSEADLYVELRKQILAYEKSPNLGPFTQSGKAIPERNAQGYFIKNSFGKIFIYHGHPDFSAFVSRWKIGLNQIAQAQQKIQGP